MRDSFVFYSSFYEAIQTLDSADAGECVKALANYALNGVLPEDNKPLVKMFFTLVKPQVDANNQKYENGLKGGRPKNQTETKNKPKNNQTETKPEPNVNENENVNVNVNENNKNIQSNDCIKKREVKKFVKPSLEEVIAYCRERNNNVDPERWYDWYEANGWKSGKNPMKDWRAAVRTWERGTESVRPAVTVAANDGWTAEDEQRHQKTMSLVEATKRMLAEQTRARFGV